MNYIQLVDSIRNPLKVREFHCMSQRVRILFYSETLEFNAYQIEKDWPNEFRFFNFFFKFFSNFHVNFRI